jgi:hypothetical protein
MATNRDLLKEAIADAKAVKETAIANAKAALEEAFAPQLKEMFTAKLREMEDEYKKEDTYENVDSDLDDVSNVDEIDLEELLRELELQEGDMDSHLNEAEDDDKEDMPMPDEDSDEGDEKGDPLDLEDLTDEDLKDMIEDVIKDMIKAGEIEAGHEEMGSEEGAKENDDEDEDDFNLAELLREIEEMESLDERKKYGGNKGDEKRDDMKKEKEGHGKGPKKKDTAEDEKEIDYKKKLKEELEEAYSAIESLKSELNEINLLNAKLLYTNKIFKSKNLNESQKLKVLNSFDKAVSVGEVKLVFETLNEGIKVKKDTIKENLGSASKMTMAPNVKKPIVESNDAFLRMQKLAGII